MISLPNLDPATKPLPAHFSDLYALLELGDGDCASIHAKCRELAELGAAGVYLGDAVFRYRPAHAVAPTDSVIIAEPDGVITVRPPEDADRIRAKLHKHGLTAHGLHFTQTLPPPGESVAWLWPHFRRLVETAVTFGVTYLTTHPGWMYGAACPDYTGDLGARFAAGELTQLQFLQACHQVYGPDRIRPDSIQIYRRLCDMAAGYGMRVTIETAICEWTELTNDPAAIHQFIDDVDRPNLGICIDPGHCLVQGLDPAQIARDCGDRLWETHLHDNDGTADQHRAVGDGVIDWQALIDAFIAIDYRGDITFECKHSAACFSHWRSCLAARPHA